MRAGAAAMPAEAESRGVAATTATAGPRPAGQRRGGRQGGGAAGAEVPSSAPRAAPASPAEADRSGDSDEVPPAACGSSQYATRGACRKQLSLRGGTLGGRSPAHKTPMAANRSGSRLWSSPLLLGPGPTAATAPDASAAAAPPRAASPPDARSCRKRPAPRSREMRTPLGVFGGLPPELLDCVLLRCGAPELAALCCTCSYFVRSGAAAKAAQRQLLASGRGAGLAPDLPSGETWLQLLHFVSRAQQAERAARAVGLGGKHSLLLLQRDPAAGPSGPPPAGASGCRASDGAAEPEPASPAPAADGPASRTRSDVGYGKGGGGGRPELHACGRGFHGQLGRGTFDNAARPARVAVRAPAAAAAARAGADGADADGSAAHAIVAVSCGGSHTAALTAGGALLTWGLASSGELGHGGWTPIEMAVPRRLSVLAEVRIVAVAAGANHTVAVGACGALWTCGRGRHGQLGHGDYFDLGRMQPVEALRGVAVAAVAAGGTHTLALDRAGELWAWGNARSGQLGTWLMPGDEVEFGVPLPRRVELGAAAVLLAAAAPAASAAGGAAGSSLRDAAVGRAAGPAAAPAAPQIVSVSAGTNHSAVVTGTGRVLAFGRNRNGALGLGDREDRALPALVPLWSRDGRRPARVLHVACGGGHTLALTSEGAVLATGANFQGQLGLGDVAHRCQFTEVRRLAAVGARAVAAGEDHSAALAADGAVFLFGRGDLGQLGLGDAMAKWAPAALPQFRVVLPE